MCHPRVIILQTTPYSTNNSSRSLDSYFHFWEKDKVRQIFSRNWKPQKGHCGELYQITDANLVKRWLHRITETGEIYRYDDLEEQGTSDIIEDTEAVAIGYRIGRLHTPLVELFRGLLWRKKYWCTRQLIEWLDEYNPEVVFYNFSNNIFLQRIALFVADRYNIPIVTAVGDDYYFNDRVSISPLYWIYRAIFRSLTRRVFSHHGCAVYVCDKIRDKYNSEFGLKGETIYCNSTVIRKPFSYINTNSPSIMYFGNVGLGRNHALVRVADALERINKDYKLHVYSTERNAAVIEMLHAHPSIVFSGGIPYSEVLKKLAQCEIYVVVESFREKDIAFTRYSLSTKVADGLTSGAAVFAFGPKESGLIDYLSRSGAAQVCIDEKTLENSLVMLLTDAQFQKSLYMKSLIIAKENHSIEGSNRAFEKIIHRVIS